MHDDLLMCKGTLMNLNRPLGEVYIDEHGDVEFRLIELSPCYYPYEMRNHQDTRTFRNFIQARVTPITRQGLQEELSSLGYGTYSIPAILLTTNGRDCSDVYWIRFFWGPQTWEEAWGALGVEHPVPSDISRYIIGEGNHSSLFPEHTGGELPFREFSPDEVYSLSTGASSIGNQRKFKTKDGRYYIKGRFQRNGILWKDNMVESIASKYASLCNLPREVSVVRQGLCKLGPEECSYSEAFDVGGSAFLPFYRVLGPGNQEKLKTLLSKSRSIVDSISVLRDYYSKYTDELTLRYLVSMMLLDVIVGNEDRHLNNFGYTSTFDHRLLQPGPLFDFGLGMFEHDNKYDHWQPLWHNARKARIMPWNVRPEKVIDHLMDYHSDFVSKTLPEVITLSDFNFPSALARDYFVWANQRLGVRVEDNLD